MNRDPLAAPRKARETAQRKLALATLNLRQAVLEALDRNDAEADVARRAGVDRMTVRSWRAGRAEQTPDMPIITDESTLYQVDPADLSAAEAALSKVFRAGRKNQIPESEATR